MESGNCAIFHTCRSGQVKLKVYLSVLEKKITEGMDHYFHFSSNDRISVQNNQVLIELLFSLHV